MTDRAINFSAPMARALMEGVKTQTRRLIRDAAPEGATSAGVFASSKEGVTNRWSWLSGDPRDCDTWEFLGDLTLPYRPGDRLWVREEYYQRGHWEPQQGLTKKGRKQKWAFVAADDVVRFDAPESFRKGRHNADPATVAWHKRLGRFMPRTASRTTLHVTEVRVERLQAISEGDANAEGVERDSDGWRDYQLPAVQCCGTASESFRTLWNSINGPESWDANPWVVAVTFTIDHRNIDTIREAA